MPKRDACGCWPPTNRSLDTAGSCSIALALTQSSPKSVSSPLPLSMPFSSLRERRGRCSSLIACSCQRSKTWGASALQNPIVSAAAYAPPLACPTSHEKALPIAAAQVLLCVALRPNDPFGVTVDDQFGPLGYTSEARGADMEFSVVHGTENESSLPESLAQGHEKRDEFVLPRKKNVQFGARATRMSKCTCGKKTTR